MTGQNTVVQKWFIQSIQARKQELRRQLKARQTNRNEIIFIFPLVTLSKTVSRPEVGIQCGCNRHQSSNVGNNTDTLECTVQ